MARDPGLAGLGRRLAVPGLGRWAAVLVIAGLLAALPVLVERVTVEAAYRSVTLVVEVPGRSWQEVLPDRTTLLREQGAGAVLLPVEALADPGELEAVRASGFPVFLFWLHPPTPDEIDRRLEEAQGAGVPVALVGGVGGAGARPEGSGGEWVPAPGIRLALVEMEGNPVWAEQARLEPGRAVVTHWIPPADWEEYQGSGVDDARLARYVRAARERQVRVLVVPLVPTAEGSPDPGYLEAVARALRSEGFLLGDPPVLPPFGAGPAQRFLMGAAVGAAFLLALRGLWSPAGGRPGQEAPGRLPWVLGVAVPAGVGTAALVPQGWLDLPWAGEISGAAVVAFVAAVVFPAWAVLSLRREPVGGEAEYRRPLAGLVQAFFLALAGGLLVSGLLSSREALLRLELFRGVKAMHLASPLVVAAVLLPAPLRAWLRWSGTAARAKGARKGSRHAWIGVGLLAGLVLVGAVVYYVGRTGNELVPVPAWERELRDEIEAVLGARPRFKELFGHAALFAGLAVLGYRGNAGGGAGRQVSGRGREPLPGLVGTALVVAGTVGQLSVVNSLSHLHQPFLLSLQRVAYGGLGGLALGVLLAAVVRWGLSSWQRWAVDRSASQP